ncbi:MAG: UDP-N-acetyl-D-glucosamine dehydrogenase [Acidobacteria bacterium RIFCSPLOWO2_02_FULL_67_36]|nr:MAG: UDP-N-acetyl-D-glucosamine dehydrogenase [Acidobacteria bacterium RIFCSPLOWO2_02_FULL_67_36]OFW26416.1 MAG: UDP-N-acetyl-D-glucosamine dehydrogenase [Acidobacteria bacterium RIFCSPLOWO2_12_FULL_66_21]
MSLVAAALLEKIQSRRARTGVVGLGYVGLPLAVELGRAGFHATGIDLDERKVAAITAGRSYIPDVPTADLVSLTRAGRLDATTDFSIVRELDTINICVPTPLRKTKDPDMSYIVSAVEAIAKYLHEGMLIALESTTYPGTTEEVVQPLLEATGLKAGRDFFLAFSPERVDPGNPTFQTHNVPKVVGGLTPDCAKLAAALYGTAIETIVPVSSTRVAEMVKLLENTFRAVNIGLVNELALMCDKMKIDVWEVVDAAKTKPFGFMAFYPGPGLGGHCIPIDPFYLSWKAKQTGFDPRFIELAGHINGGMPHYVVEKAADALNTRRKSINGSRILVAGVAYKRDIDDMRESPALDVMGLLHAKGASVAYADPFVPVVHAREWSGGHDIRAVDLTRGSIGQYDCVIIVTDHKSFDYDAIVAEADVVVDTRNAIKQRHPNVFRLGAPGPESQGSNIAIA